uniref:Uncharacterized protein n=1 Tax=Arundo donax TaxID=35708 RepID=A0A0A8ZE83_ARUDO
MFGKIILLFSKLSCYFPSHQFPCSRKEKKPILH